MRSLVAASCLVAVVFALSACSTIEEDLCDAECECEGCSEWEYDDCVAHYDHEERDAEYWGCEDHYDGWVECREETYYCDRGNFETNCGRERQWLNDCTHR